jgi:hypothetical protein
VEAQGDLGGVAPLGCHGDKLPRGTYYRPADY